ncbi:MAG: acyl-CoA dehydrogenase [Gemmatimonadetes bacterium]|nr:acyl-CoA dehydrogenase [Gemmatimonadota bacterium]|tara:strand:- start:3362 stop:4531 length:1170 start_codon:yes stop_codon:yes gene_type:complete
MSNAPDSYDHPALTSLSEDERMFKEAIKSFALAEIEPLVREMESKQKINQKLITAMFEMGLMGIEIPEEFGGAQSSFFNTILLIEEISKFDPSVAILIDVQNTLVNNALCKWGSKEVQATYLPKLASEWIGAYALSESGSGSDAFGLECKATQQGSNWVLNGHKLWITSAEEASLYIVFANIDPSLGYKGITAFLVERDSPGFSVGKKEDKLGIRASSTNELILEDVKVPEAQILGVKGEGYKVAIQTLNEGRIGIGAQMIGLAQGAIDHTKRYLKEREQFGKPITDFQGVQFQLAEAATELEASRLLVYNAARLKDQDEDFLVPAAMAKLHSSRMAQRVTSLCVDLYGGYGFTTEYPIEKLYRDSKIGTIYEGTTNMQLQTIAKVLLK